MEKKTRQKSLKALQQELFELVEQRYVDDPEIAECVNKINDKYKEMQIRAEKRKLEKQSLGEKIKDKLVKISLKTLQLCDKLITKEKVSNKIMGYEVSEELENADAEIKAGLVEWGK